MAQRAETGFLKHTGFHGRTSGGKPMPAHRRKVTGEGAGSKG